MSYKQKKARVLPVLFRNMHRQHLQGLHTLDHPAVSLTDPGCVHLQEVVGHTAPQHSADGLHVESRGALGDRVLVLTLKGGGRERHGILHGSATGKG